MAVFVGQAGGELPSLEELTEVGEELFSQLPQDVQTQIQEDVAPQVEEAAKTLEVAINEGSLEELAELRPQAEAFLRSVSRHDWSQPYADWLIPRLDFFVVAGDSMEKARAAETETQAREQAKDGGQIERTTTPAVETGLSTVVARRAEEIASDTETWRRRLLGQPVPARAATHLADAKRIFTEEGVPPEWVWLAEVESAWNPKARSPAGALGLFQFMPATAERFGMSLRPVDERLHVEKNTRAAAQYLRFLYGRFTSWPLALAAYNAGEGRVGRLLAKTGGQTFAEIADRLPTETRMYVPKVLATVALREGVDPEALPAPRGGDGRVGGF